MKSLDSNQFLKPKLPNDLESSKIPEYSLEEGVERVLEIIQEKLLTQKKPIIVEIAGGSASGKTSTVAFKIKEALGDKALVLSMDNYCHEKSFIDNKNRNGENINFDQPEALNLELLKNHLIKLQQGKAIEKPIFDLKESKLKGQETIQPHRVIIVEGLFALNNLIVKEGDIKVFVDVNAQGRLLRRLFRDITRSGKKSVEVLRYFLNTVEPMHDKHVQSTASNAGLIIRNGYDSKIEAKKLDLNEIQFKFKGEIDLENLQKIGAKILTSVDQEDCYYSPNGVSLNEFGEILRIRHENRHKILTYKGPRLESDLQIRSQFEFEIDDEIETKFSLIYGSPLKIIKKKCILYQLNNIIFSIDDVFKIENEKETRIGKFIEIRSTNRNTDTEKIRDVILKLGLSIKDDLKKSYSEM